METRTNIVLDDALVAQAMARARVKTKKAAIEAALKAFVRKPDYSGLLSLRGAGMLADDYDPDEAYRQYPIEPLSVQEERADFVPNTAKLSASKSKVAKSKPGKRANP